MKHLKLLILFVLFALGVMVRLYGLNNPVADWHSWRQSDTAAVARNFLKFGFDPLRPRYDDLSNIQSGKDNPNGYRMVEFPLYQMIGAMFKQAVGIFSIEVWLRLVTIAASAGSVVLLILLVTKIMGPLTGILAGFIYAVLPYGVYYGRTILPEPFTVFWSVLSVYLVAKSRDLVDKGYWALILLAAATGAIALLTKPFAIFLLAPVPYLFWRRWGISKYLFICLFVYWFIGLFPLWLWREWILQYPEGIPVYTWLFNNGNIRFKGAWFYWLFARRLGELILGYWGLVPFGIGLAVKTTTEEGWFGRFWLLGALLFLVIIAAGNVQHDYYQILLLPVVSMYLARGCSFLLKDKTFSHVARYVLLATSFVFMLAFSWYTVRTYYWVNRPEIVEAGRVADQLLPSDAKVIASYNGDTTFLYQINRQGWPLGFDIDQKIAMGATHYVTVSPTDDDFETKTLAETYTVIVRNDKFAIIDLTKPQ